MLPMHPSFAFASFLGLVTRTGRELDATVVWLRGEHDIGTVDQLTETIARAMALDDADLVLDLSEVDFMGAATVGVILRTRELLHRRSRSLTLRSPSASARRVLELCNLHDLLGHPVDAHPPATNALVTGLRKAMSGVARFDGAAVANGAAPAGAPPPWTPSDPVPADRFGARPPPTGG